MGYISSVSSDVQAYSTVTTSGEVTFSGLGNGTDFDEIIDATIDAESFKKEEYEAQKEETEYIVDILDSLKDEIVSLNETLDEMDEPDEFYDLVATSSSDEVEVEASGEASEGLHTLIIDQLAQKDVWVNTELAFDSEDDVVTTSATTLNLTFQGEMLSVDISAGTTLSGLVDTINASIETRDKIEADLIYDGDNYYFVLSSADTGADNAITITDTGALTDFDIADFTNTLTAQDSRIKVDGFPADADKWIERDSNSIDDVVEGLTLDLKGVTSDEGITISVEFDTDAIADKIATFIESVNQIILDMQTLTGRVESDDDEEDTYTINSYALDIMYNEIKDILSSGALGFSRYDDETGGDVYNALSQIGISTDVDEGSDTFGQLLIDDDALEEALDNDAEAVALLFSSRGVGESDSEDFQVVSVIDGTTPAGEHTVEYTVSNGVLTSATIDGEDASIDGWTVLGTGSDSKGIYLSIGNQTDGTYSGTARVKQGKVGQLADALSSMTTEDSGTLSIIINNYEEGITSLDNQIYNEEKRLDSLENSLTLKYANLDSTLSTYSNITTLLETLVADLE